MASIHNEYEQSYVTALLREKYNDYWLGLWAPDGKTFYYEDDSEFDYANWMSNKPTYSSNVMIFYFKISFYIKYVISFLLLKSKG